LGALRKRQVAVEKLETWRAIQRVKGGKWLAVADLSRPAYVAQIEPPRHVELPRCHGAPAAVTRTTPRHADSRHARPPSPRAPTSLQGGRQCGRPTPARAWMRAAPGPIDAGSASDLLASRDSAGKKGLAWVSGSCRKQIVGARRSNTPHADGGAKRGAWNVYLPRARDLRTNHGSSAPKRQQHTQCEYFYRLSP